MKSSGELLLDIVFRKKKHIELYIEELEGSIDISEETSSMLYKYDINSLKEDLVFLDEIKEKIKLKTNALEYLKKYLREKEKNEELTQISKYEVLKQLLKEYKIEYKKNYSYNKFLGLNGIFYNDLFCNVIRKKIEKYTDCNKVTRKKYSHLVAFLNEFLNEMENSSDPLKTLKQKMKMYEKFKKYEYIEIRNRNIRKSEILKDILKEYNEVKNNFVR